MPTPDADPSATLEAIKADLRLAADGGLLGVKAGDYLPAALARHARVLLDAVEAVLKAHRPSTTDGRCCWCRDADGQRSAWPCGEYLTIARALKGGTDE